MKRKISLEQLEYYVMRGRRGNPASCKLRDVVFAKDQQTKGILESMMLQPKAEDTLWLEILARKWQISIERARELWA